MRAEHAQRLDAAEQKGFEKGAESVHIEVGERSRMRRAEIWGPMLIIIINRRRTPPCSRRWMDAERQLPQRASRFI